MIRVRAVAIEPNCDYLLDLTQFGVRPEWNIEIIWTVAKREMKNSWNKYPTAIEFIDLP